MLAAMCFAAANRKRPGRLMPGVLLAAAFLILMRAAAADDGDRCLDNDGNDVDWWFTYKLPDGYQFAYVDSSSRPPSGPLQLWPTTLDSDTHPAALIRTLRALVPSEGASGSRGVNASAGSGTTPYFLYNDQPDNTDPGSDYGHTKGVVAVGDDAAFWIVHSTPKFPSSSGSGKFFFPSTETDYGQTFLCMSISADDINTVAGQLLYTKPYVYYNNVPSSTTDKHPNLGKVFAGDWVTSPGTNVASFDVGGSRFSSLAKNGEWGGDIYEGLVAPTLEVNLLVETWIRGDAIGPSCPPKNRYAVTDVSKCAASDGTSWTESQDHAKWCVALGGSHQLCVCGINRMTSQRVRGGGCVCFDNEGLHGALNSTITAAWAC